LLIISESNWQNFEIKWEIYLRLWVLFVLKEIKLDFQYLNSKVVINEIF
jgi:hypothetical protein